MSQDGLPSVASPLRLQRLQQYVTALDRRHRVDPACPSGVMYVITTAPAPNVVYQWTVAMDPANFGADATPDHVDALLDLARNNREQDFRDLALMVGVEREQIDALWTGAVRRLKGSAA